MVLQHILSAARKAREAWRVHQEASAAAAAAAGLAAGAAAAAATADAPDGAAAAAAGTSAGAAAGVEVEAGEGEEPPATAAAAAPARGKKRKDPGVFTSLHIHNGHTPEFPVLLAVSPGFQRPQCRPIFLHQIKPSGTCPQPTFGPHNHPSGAALAMTAQSELHQLRLACVHPQLTAYWRKLSSELQLGAVSSCMALRAYPSLQPQQTLPRRLCGFALSMPAECTLPSFPLSSPQKQISK